MENRNKRQEDLAASIPAFRVWLCGPLRVERRVGTGYEGVQTAEWGGSHYPRLLLKGLLCRPGRQERREALLDLLWPDADPEQAAQYLNTATTKLRRVLQPVKGQESLLMTEGDSAVYRLADQAMLWVDADEGLALLKEAEQRGRMLPEALPLLEQAATCFTRGVFLQEEGLWVAGRRATVEQARYRCRLWLAEAYEQQGMPGQAETALSLLLEEDATDEDVLCRLLWLLHRQGMTSQALRRYQQACEFFDREGLELTEATKHVAEQLVTSDRSISPPAALSSFSLGTNPLPGIFLGMRDRTDEILSLSELVFPVDDRAESGASIAQIITEVDDWVGHAAFCQELQLILAQKVRMANLQLEQQNGQESFLKQETLLTALVTLPHALFSSFQQKRRPAIQAESLLPRCAASLMACWFLMNASSLTFVEQSLLTYLPALEALAQQYSKYQAVAAHLATEGYMLRAILALHRLALAEREHYCRKAITSSNLSGDPRLQAGAWMYLGYTHCYQGKPEEAIPTFLQALHCLGKLRSLLRSDIYMGLACAYGQCQKEKEACEAITLAQQYFPAHPEHEPDYLYASCGLSALYIWEGRTYLALGEHFPDRGYYQKAWKALGQVSGTRPASERDRTEILIYQSKAALGKRELAVASDYLEIGLDAAKALGSKRRVSEACEVYRQMCNDWPNEPRMRALLERFRPYLLERNGEL
ncbi:MAG: hypothetical protein IMW89_06650 [Ktedonobacteraceae bacterium]|nr:hypothetical protein [Ktedonobacteraceae bacterium]